MNRSKQEYRMVFANIGDHASSESIFASMSSEQIQMAISEDFVKFSLAGISLSLKGNVVLCQVIWPKCPSGIGQYEQT